MKVIKTGGVTTPLGFKTSGLNCGIKQNGKNDLAMIVSIVPAATAIMTTQNVVKAAPILWCNKVMEKPYKQAIVVNSGNANACTGEKGDAAVTATAQKVAEGLGIEAQDVLVASTGVIGVPLPVEKILAGIDALIPQLGNTEADGNIAANTILTTDLVQKSIAVAVEIGSKTVSIGGMAKGSGMIHPNMATMLSFVTTDANISPELLKKLLWETTQDTYNMISVDGDTSTNDMVTVMASGLAENELLEENTPDYEVFKEAFVYVHKTLAKKIIRDGEGATKFVEVEVYGTRTKAEARTLAKSVITSSLVKTALFGEDANWGRVLCALGYSGASFDPFKVSLVFSSQAGMITLLNDGVPIAFDEDEAKKVLLEKDINISVEMKEGDEKAVAWGCDLSYEYVKINGDYRS